MSERRDPNEVGEERMRRRFERNQRQVRRVSPVLVALAVAVAGIGFATGNDGVADFAIRFALVVAIYSMLGFFLWRVTLRRL